MQEVGYVRKDIAVPFEVFIPSFEQYEIDINESFSRACKYVLFVAFNINFQKCDWSHYADTVQGQAGNYHALPGIHDSILIVGPDVRKTNPFRSFAASDIGHLNIAQTIQIQILAQEICSSRVRLYRRHLPRRTHQEPSLNSEVADIGSYVNIVIAGFKQTLQNIGVSSAIASVHPKGQGQSAWCKMQTIPVSLDF